MHAQRIIQDLLATECPSIHARRRACVAAMTEAGSKGGLILMGMSRVASSATSLRHRIKQCDRLSGNSKLAKARHLIYGAMARRILHRIAQPLIIVDWSDLCPDRSQQLLRAALIVQGRALTLYEEVHPLSRAASLKVHRAFLKRLKAILPPHCEPVFITDAGFRSTWFKLLDGMGYAWIGRIRNRDMVCSISDDHVWHGCKTLYAKATCEPRDLGQFHYVRCHPVACRLVLIKKKAKGGHRTTVYGDVARSRHSLKQARAQKEPWLLAVSPQLAARGARRQGDRGDRCRAHANILWCARQATCCMTGHDRDKATLRAKRFGAAWKKSAGHTPRRPQCPDCSMSCPMQACGHGRAKPPRTRRTRWQTRGSRHHGSCEDGSSPYAPPCLGHRHSHRDTIRNWPSRSIFRVTRSA